MQQVVDSQFEKFTKKRPDSTRIRDKKERMAHKQHRANRKNRHAVIETVED